MPTITVTDKLFVHMATIRVGIIAKRTVQSIDINDDLSLLIKLSTISAVKIQMGIYESHLTRIFGSLIFLITINGIILGIKVTRAHPKMTNNMDKLILICLLPLQ
jgi:Na+-translocating ferredoxin:NAD+ oxidoreductase RnfE subunit